MTQLALACQLSTAELQARKAGLLASLRSQTTALELMPDGARLTWPHSEAVLVELLDLIRLESACCQFLPFELHTGPVGTPITLTVSGPPGTSAFLAGLGWT
jgi:hypothetical protein